MQRLSSGGSQNVQDSDKGGEISMAFFGFLKGKVNSQNAQSNSPDQKVPITEDGQLQTVGESKHIPREVFVEEREPGEILRSAVPKETGVWDRIFDFLNQDFYEMGYLDALENPEDGLRVQRIKSIKEKMILLIDNGLFEIEKKPTNWKREFR
ncbi:MAG: hypothetical protein N2513_10555 [Deltaproteobacteria bacterium]|nr:hypothetical protein [Deltaproteobacteria bacterium]